MIVRFKSKSKQQDGAAKPRPAAPSRAPDWDPNDVETPEPKRRLKSFEQKREYVAILEYRDKARSGGPRIQKLNFKAEGGFSNAAQAAYNISTLVGKAIAIDLHEARNEKLCRVLAVYEVNSFKDWQNENTTLAKNTKHIDKAVKIAKKDRINPISYTHITDVKVR